MRYCFLPNSRDSTRPTHHRSFYVSFILILSLIFVLDFDISFTAPRFEKLASNQSCFILGGIICTRTSFINFVLHIVCEFHLYLCFNIQSWDFMLLLNPQRGTRVSWSSPENAEISLYDKKAESIRTPITARGRTQYEAPRWLKLYLDPQAYRLE